jgi:hypothetical protein
MTGAVDGMQHDHTSSKHSLTSTVAFAAPLFCWVMQCIMLWHSNETLIRQEPQCFYILIQAQTLVLAKIMLRLM